MSFLKKLFGGDKTVAENTVSETIEHEGFSIAVTPMKDGGQYRVCGVISKEVNGQLKEHTLIRADLFPNKEECENATLRKAKQVIAEQGNGLFG